MNTLQTWIPQLSAIELATKGLKKLEGARAEEKEAICDFFLAQVEKEGNEIEKGLAQVALAPIQDEGIISFKAAMLSSISRGIPGPVGMAIARVALEGLEKISRRSVPQVAQEFVKAIAGRGNDYEREMASSVLALSGNARYFEQGKGALKFLEMTAQGLPPSPSVVDAEVGLAAMEGSREHSDKWIGAEVGARFLAGAAEKGTQVEKTIARMVLEPFSKLKPFKNTNDSLRSSWESAYHAVNQALISIATHGGAPLDAALIDLGLHVQVAYKRSIVETLSKESGDPALSAVAGALSETFAHIHPFEEYKADLGIHAFMELQKSAGLTTDAALVRNALKARDNTRLMENKERARAIIGTAFLKAMADRATMPENRKAAREALDACTPHGFLDRIFRGKKDAEISEIQSEAFKAIMNNLKKAELEAELRREMEKSVAERVLGGPESEQAAPAAAVEEAETFIEVDGVRLSRKQWECLCGNSALYSRA